MFESLDDLGVRTAGTTYLMYRGRYEHQTSKTTALTRLASTVFRRPVMGPKELFYADIFASRETPCRSQLGLPGIRDQHAGCVGAYLVEQDLFDFLLLSLPDNDTHSHRHGPHAQVTSIAAADRQLERLFHAGGGTEKFLDEHAVIVVADHSHAPVEKAIDLQAAYAELERAGAVRGAPPRRRDRRVPGPAQRDGLRAAARGPRRAGPAHRRDRPGHRRRRPRALAPGAARGRDRQRDRRAALRPRRRRARRARRAVVDRRPAGASSTRASRTASCAATPIPTPSGARGRRSRCPTSGDVLLSAAPGYEFADWGGVDHVGGGSHGSLHRVDSLGALAFCGVRGAARPRVMVDRRRRADGARALRRLTGVAFEHLG